jgi:hypothetical protein
MAATVKRGGRINARSEAREDEREERAALVLLVLREDWRCAAGVVGVCTRYSSECNEIIRRSQWRAGYLVRDNCEGLCHACHRHVTENPGHDGWAARHGHQLMSTDRGDPDAVVMARHVRQATRGRCDRHCTTDHREEVR